MEQTMKSEIKPFHSLGSQGARVLLLTDPDRIPAWQALLHTYHMAIEKPSAAPPVPSPGSSPKILRKYKKTTQLLSICRTLKEAPNVT